MKLCPICKNTYPDDYQVCPRDQTVLAMVGTEIVPGTILRGKYEVISELGAGGMATVYKVRHRAFQELAAVKVVHAHFMHDAGFNKRFRNEAVVARQLKHPNAVRIDDFDHTEDGRPFIVMEFVDGLSLFEARKGTPGAWPVERCIRIVSQAAEALGAAHALGIVHRDIKPSNIVLMRGTNDTLQVKVLDFGIAKVSGVESFAGMTTVATLQGHVIGTPEYMSPEQASGGLESGIDGRSDLYSLGLVLYELLTGAHPFQADTPMGVLNQQLYKVPAPPESLAAMPTALSALVLKMLQKDPMDRFQSAAEVVAALRDPQEWYAPGSSACAVPIPISMSVERIASVAIGETQPSPALTPAGSRWRYPVLGGLATIAIVAAGLLATRSRRSTSIVETPKPTTVKTHPDMAMANQPAVSISQPVQPQPQLHDGDVKYPPDTGKDVAKEVVDQHSSAANPQEDAVVLNSRAKKLIDAQRYAEALPLSKAACDRGNAAGCSNLGKMYANGWGVSTDHGIALTLFRTGCERGDRVACDSLVAVGIYKPEELRDNQSLLHRFCKNDNKASCDALTLYASLLVGGLDIPEAVAFYRKSCDRGNADSCTSLGVMYFSGNGVGADASNAAALFRLSCNGGQAAGCDWMGMMYADGKGVVKDASEAFAFYSRAAKLYRTSCNKGNAVTCWVLGTYYSKGTGVAMDQAQAAMMYRKACNGRFDPGCKALEPQKATANP